MLRRSLAGRRETLHEHAAVLGHMSLDGFIVARVLLRDGVRLFDHPRGTNLRLEPIRATQAPQATNLWWRVVR